MRLPSSRARSTPPHRTPDRGVLRCDVAFDRRDETREQGHASVVALVMPAKAAVVAPCLYGRTRWPVAATVFGFRCQEPSRLPVDGTNRSADYPQWIQRAGADGSLLGHARRRGSVPPWRRRLPRPAATLDRRRGTGQTWSRRPRRIGLVSATIVSGARRGVADTVPRLGCTREFCGVVVHVTVPGCWLAGRRSTAVSVR
jgi:hypothetical protein